MRAPHTLPQTNASTTNEKSHARVSPPATGLGLRRMRKLGAPFVIAASLGGLVTACGGRGVSTVEDEGAAVDAASPPSSEPEPIGGGASGGRGGAGTDAGTPAPRFTCDTADTPTRRAIVTVRGDEADQPYTTPPGPGVYDLVETVLTASVTSTDVSKGAVLRIGNGWKRSDDFGDGIPVASVGLLETVVPPPDHAFFPGCGSWSDSLWRFHVTASGFEAYRYTGGVHYVERFERRP